jgi:hypothetical protein
MGVKGFTKVFKSSTVTFKDLKNQTIAVDASLELYRAALGMKSVKGLTDALGAPTLHITVILANIIKYKLNKITTIWVFDHDPDQEQNSDHHNPLKIKELEERREKREKAKAKIKKLKKKARAAIDKDDKDDKDDLFSDSDSSDSLVSEQSLNAVADKKIKMKTEEIQESIQKQEKIAFTLQSWMVNDIKLMLNLFDIQWIESPRGVEAECLAARLTHEDVAEADAVLSSDADALLFGASTLIKKNTRTKKFERFYLSDVLSEGKITQDQLIYTGIVLGTDMYKDKEKKLFYRIGVKTVLAKVKSGVLDKKFEDVEVVQAVEHFREICDVGAIQRHNENDESFSNVDKAKQLLNWLVNTKNFNRTRAKKQINKIIKF